MKIEFVNLFTKSVSFILIGTGLANIYSLAAYNKYLEGLDPLLEIRSDLLLSFIVILEIGVACFLLKNMQMQKKLGAILWLSCLFIAYRLGLLSIGYTKPCPCLGAANSWILLKMLPWDIIMKCVFAYMFVGSIALLYFGAQPEQKKMHVGGLPT